MNNFLRENYAGRISILPPGAPRFMVYEAEGSCFRSSREIDWKEFLAIEWEENSVCAAGFCWAAKIQRPPRPGGAFWIDASASRFVWEDAWENFLRIVLAYQIFTVGGLLLHSAAVVDRGRAWLFPGLSGEGKSTLAEICRREGRIVLSDDCNLILEVEDGALRVGGLPFGGELHPRRPAEGMFPLVGIAALSHGNSNRLAVLPRSEAMALLIRCAPFVNGDCALTGALMDRVSAVLMSLDARRLEFSLDGGFWHLIENLHGRFG